LSDVSHFKLSAATWRTTSQQLMVISPDDCKHFTAVFAGSTPVSEVVTALAALWGHGVQVYFRSFPSLESPHLLIYIVCLFNFDTTRAL